MCQRATLARQLVFCLSTISAYDYMEDTKMKTIQKNTTRTGHKFEVEYHSIRMSEMQDIERSHLGSIYCGIVGMTYEFVEVA